MMKISIKSGKKQMEWENNDHFSVWYKVSELDFWPCSRIVFQVRKENFLKEMDSLTMNVVLLISHWNARNPGIENRKPQHPWLRNKGRLFFQKAQGWPNNKAIPKSQEECIGNLLGIELNVSGLHVVAKTVDAKKQNKTKQTVDAFPTFITKDSKHLPWKT